MKSLKQQRNNYEFNKLKNELTQKTRFRENKANFRELNNTKALDNVKNNCIPILYRINNTASLDFEKRFDSGYSIKKPVSRILYYKKYPEID